MMDQIQPLSDSELQQMFQLLRRYVETEMDQWEAWRFDSSRFLQVYVHIAMFPNDGTSDEAYTDITHLTLK